MDPKKTIWMGNVNNTMNEYVIRKIFKSFSNKMIKIQINRKNPYRNGSALIEFNSYLTAKNFIREYKNRIINGQLLSLNWARINTNNVNNNDKENTNNNIYYTVYVGNLNLSIDELELTNYFKKKYLSVLSSRIIKDSSNGKSKGFGFVNLSDYNEYMQLLKLDTPIILGGKMLTIK